MVETYKYKSKFATAIAFIAALISYLGKDGLAQFIPEEYAFLIPLLVFAAGFVLAQSTEDKRVEVAEQMVHEQYNEPTSGEDDIVVDPTINEETENDNENNDMIVGDEDEDN